MPKFDEVAIVPELQKDVGKLFQVFQRTVQKISPKTISIVVEREYHLIVTNFDAVILSCSMIFLWWWSLQFKILFSFDEKWRTNTDWYTVFDFSKNRKSSWPRGSDFENFLNQSLVFVRLEKLTKIKSAVALVMKIWRQHHT